MTKLQNYDLQLKAITTTGTAPDLEVSIPREDYTSLTDQKLLLKVHADCSGNVTINVNGLGAKNLIDASSNNIDSLSAGDYIEVIYNGSEFVNYNFKKNNIIEGTGVVFHDTVTDSNGVKTLTHNLGVTQVDIEAGRYTIYFHGTYDDSGVNVGITSWLGNCDKGTYSLEGLRNEWSSSNPSDVTCASWQSDTLTVYIDSSGNNFTGTIHITIVKNR